MGAAAYHRGSASIARQCAADASVLARAERDAWREQAAELRLKAAGLERELSRARRRIAAMRGTLTAERLSSTEQQRLSDAVIRQLARIAFCGEHAR